jgi:hypothetical protein
MTFTLQEASNNKDINLVSPMCAEKRMGAHPNIGSRALAADLLSFKISATAAKSTCFPRRQDSNSDASGDISSTSSFSFELCLWMMEVRPALLLIGPLAVHLSQIRIPMAAHCGHFPL